MAKLSERREREIHGNSTLSCTQLKVIGMLAEGLTRKEISGFLGVSIHTVNTELERAYSKLGAHNATGATAKAIEEGLLSN